MIFKHTKTKYVGGFKNGRFHSRGEYAKYQTQDYIYKG